MKENDVQLFTQGIGTRVESLANAFPGGKRGLAKAVGLSESQLHRIVSESSQPKLETIVAIVEKTGCSLDWIATGEGDRYVDTEMREPMADYAKALLLDDAEAEQRQRRRVSIFFESVKSRKDVVNQALLKSGLSIEDQWVDVLALWLERGFTADDLDALVSLISSVKGGPPENYHLIPGDDHVAFQGAWIGSRGLDQTSLRIVKAAGDSMHPHVSSGDTLLIDTRTNTLSDGTVCAITVDGHLLVKRVQKLMGGGFLLITDNKDYPDQEVTAEQAADVTVVGRVAWIGKDV